MHVHNYVPDPLEVGENVTERPYSVRLTFIRRVAVLHAASIGLVSILAWKLTVELPTLTAAGLYAAVLIALCLVRIVLRGKSQEPVASVALSPVLLFSAGVLVHSVGKIYPVWSAGIGLSFAVIYAMLCGRDFSFVGQFFLSLIASSTVIASLAVAVGWGKIQAAEGLVWNAAYLLFYVYDSASLLARRRVGEELAAVTDLYRDVLNVFGWIVRVIIHWRKHRIWSLPSRWG